MLTHHQFDICLTAGRNHAFSVGNGIGDGLVYENMLARPGCQESMLGMQGIWGGQMNPFNIISIENVFQTFFMIAVEFFTKRFSFRDNRIETGDQFNPFAF